MKTLLVMAFAAGALSLVQAASAQTGANVTASTGTKAQPGCTSCAQTLPVEPISIKPIPGTAESALVGRIENLMPIAVLTALGCDTCAGEAVAWALHQGSSTGDVERALRAIAAMQQLDCFKQKFGPEAAARLEKPLAAARKVLQEAISRSGN